MILGRAKAGFALSLILMALGLLACRSRPETSGYWEGKGRAHETPMKDEYREMTRSATFEFWFTLDAGGNAVGEAEIVYDAKLTVENLPSVSIGSIGFAPKVGGQVTDKDPTRRFPIVGVFDKDAMTLALAIAVPEQERPKIEFTFRADPGVSASVGAGGLSTTVPGGGTGATVQKMDMTPFEVFVGKGKVEKRPGGPYAVRAEEKGDNYAVEWSARQMGGEGRQVEMTPEMERALQELRQRLNR